jgi:hypothetical protein
VTLPQQHSDLVRSIESRLIDEILLTYTPEPTSEWYASVQLACHIAGVSIRQLMQETDIEHVNRRVSTFAGHAWLEQPTTNIGSWGRIGKRATDIVGSVVLIILLLP